MSEPETKSVKGFETATLYCGVAGGVTALDAARALTGDDAFILAYTPDFCGFAVFQDGKLSTLDGEGIEPESLFELRCFRQDRELRWVREGETGRSVTLSETPLDGLTPVAFYIRSGRYLLWGKGARRGDVTRLFEHRVGELPVPAVVEEKLEPGGRVWLSFDEYFSPDEYGNLVWRLERLKGLEAE